MLQTSTYRAHGDTKQTSNTVCLKSHGPTAPGADDIWSGESFALPPLPPTGMPYCNLIDTQYKLKVRIWLDIVIVLIVFIILNLSFIDFMGNFLVFVKRNVLENRLEEE